MHLPAVLVHKGIFYIITNVSVVAQINSSLMEQAASPVAQTVKIASLLPPTVFLALQPNILLMDNA